MNAFKYLAGIVERVVDELGWTTPEGARPDLSRVTVDPPRDPAHGDLATNAAMVLAKPLKSKPRDLAEQLAAGIAKADGIASAEVAGPGFVNVRLTPEFWTGLLGDLLRIERPGRSDLGAGSRVNVEYVSANPTGPMHVGHCRGAVVGDALANVLEAAGYDVTREYYVNDAGVQIDVLARSTFLRYREALGQDVGTIPVGLYPGDYLVPVGQSLAAEFGDSLLGMDEAEWLPIVRDRSIDAMMDLIRADLAALNVSHDLFFSERTLHAPGSDGRSPIAAAIERLTLDGHVYRGKLPPPKGEVPEDWEDREQTLFRSTAVGDDMDRPLVKADGSYSYFAADVAYYRDKFRRNFPWTIFVLGADHGGYVKRLQAVAKAVAGDAGRLTVILTQLVRLMRGGELVRMSKRSGDLVTLREVVDEVGVDAVRFMMLYRRADAPLDFDFEKVTEQSKDNPVFYVQYAHARCHSVFRQAVEAMPDWSPDDDPQGLDRLSHPSEIALIRKLAEFQRVIEQAASALEPHRVAFYLYELATAFHAHWNLGKDQPETRFIKADDLILTRGRLSLVDAVRRTLAEGLAIVGASAPSEMR